MSKAKWIVGAIVVVIVAVWLLSVANVLPLGAIPRFGPEYQAVFLSNGQVYFGKLYRERSQYPVLRDIYYLQITQSPQPIRPGETPPANINVVKLGEELHGPMDEMRINRDQILFIEDLKPESRVLQAIQQFKETQGR